MRIVISGVKHTPKWVTIQEAIREALDLPSGKLVKIDRKDNGVDYRSPGEYALEFRALGEKHNIDLSITSTDS